MKAFERGPRLSQAGYIAARDLSNNDVGRALYWSMTGIGVPYVAVT
jgi:hypothetical protein